MDADRRWDADDLRRVEPDGTAYDVTPDGAMPPQVIRSDSGPYSQYSPLGEANQIVSFSRAAGRSGPLGRVFVWVFVAVLVGSAFLGVVNWFSQPNPPGSQTSDSP